jgi:hypothetical protein
LFWPDKKYCYGSRQYLAMEETHEYKQRVADSYASPAGGRGETISPSLRRIVGGDYADSEGWRYRPGYSWDNTCFKNLNYLDSQFACGTGGGKR